MSNRNANVVEAEPLKQLIDQTHAAELPANETAVPEGDLSYLQVDLSSLTDEDPQDLPSAHANSA